jgi:hypothetical protein
VADQERVLVTDLVAAERTTPCVTTTACRKPKRGHCCAAFSPRASSTSIRRMPWRRSSPRPARALADRLIHARHQALGATTLTFDREQGRLEGTAMLE